MGGFESSTHCLGSGRRLDMVAATGHDHFCRQDYARLREIGIGVAREGLRWPMIDLGGGRYDFRFAEPFVEAAREQQIQIIWDLSHFGYPGDVDVFSAAYVPRYRDYARAFIEWLLARDPTPPFIAPVNEISFFSWGGGDCGYLNPFARGRGFELKVQFARAAVAAMEAIRQVEPRTRFTQIDPAIHIACHPNRPELRDPAERHRQAQFQAWDMLGGRLWPQIGGREEYLDIIGVNFYPDNQWIHEYGVIRRDHSLYRPLTEILLEIYQRYQRPMFISETGCENEDRADWLRYVCAEVQTARERGAPVHGICLYPIVNHPGWDDNRHCHNGLWDYADPDGNREIYQPLAAEIHRARAIFENGPAFSMNSLVQA